MPVHVVEPDTGDKTVADAAEEPTEPAVNPLGACEDRLKRAMADLENMRRRAESDVSLRVASAVEPIMAELVNIRDDLARARDASSGADASGLDGILKNTDALLARNGVTEINAIGEPFDPLKHESVRLVDDPALDDGTVMSVARKGYICHGRVLRPSLVEVSRRVSEKDG